MDAQAVADQPGSRLDGPIDRLLDGKYALADPAGHVTRWGAGAAELFALPPEQAVGRSLFDSVLRGHDQAWQGLVSGATRAGSVVIDCSVTRPDGQLVPCAVQLVPVRLTDGLEVSFFAADLAADEPRDDKLASLRSRHSRVLALVAQADANPLEGGQRLAGLIAIFDGEVPAAAAGPEVEEALARASAVESELAELRASVRDGAAPAEAATAAVAEVRALAERALAAAEAAARDAELARTEAQQARAEAAGGRGDSAGLRGELEEARGEAQQALREAQNALQEAEVARREAEQARREVRGARQASPAHPRPAGFFADSAHPGEPDRPHRSGFDDATAAMAKLGLDGSFMELNGGFRDLVGYTEEEFASARWPSSADREHLVEQRELLRQLAAGERDDARVATSYMHREGLLVALAGRIALVRNDSGAPDHLLLTLDAPASSGGYARPMG